MLAVHSAFRSEFQKAVEVVRAGDAGDPGRAALVAEHLQLTMSLLQHHHELEDRLLWAPLLARVGEEHAPTVLLIEAQHERISAQLDELQEATTAYAADPDDERQRILANACAHLYSLLDEHLTAEERRLLPLAAQHIAEEGERE
jgi:hemerythrin-like domain-containing protein